MITIISIELLLFGGEPPKIINKLHVSVVDIIQKIVRMKQMLNRSPGLVARKPHP